MRVRRSRPPRMTHAPTRPALEQVEVSPAVSPIVTVRCCSFLPVVVCVPASMSASASRAGVRVRDIVRVRRARGCRVVRYRFAAVQWMDVRDGYGQ